MVKESAPVHDTTSLPQISASSDPALKMKTETEPNKAAHDTTIAIDNDHLSLGQADSRYATDSSWAAYRVYIAILFSEALLFGISLSFGVFQDYYSNQVSLPNHQLASWIGVLSSGIPYLGTPFITYLCEAISIKPHYYIILGWALTVIGLLSSAFCHDVKPLIATQGLLYGIGVLLVEMPSLIIMNTWFVKRRGLFFGLLCGVLDLFGVARGFLASSMLNKHGLRITLLTMAAIAFVIPGICLFFIRERPVYGTAQTTTEDSHVSAPSTQQGVATELPPANRYYQRPTFYLFLIANLLQALAFYLPFIYLPSYTTILGYSTSKGAMVLAVANIAQIVGEISFGRLSDKFSVHMLATISATVACGSTFILWSLADSLAYVIAFAFVFGAFASGFIALWPRMGTMFAERDANMIYSFLSCGRGLGVIVSGPISSSLLKVGRSRGNDSTPAQTFKALIVFVGSCMAAGAFITCIGWVSSIHKSLKKSRGKVEDV
ncbi:hypothetical protein LTR84_011055 [Exophiala bonariae]|uniref:Major facilitator superfamily (MFS) profile domain-containing protein n=1 Tax=Exophiala bonariae TaxID=1690606 RepID=A0AAV9NIG7_9EURO|nr:hypothetical protein LTR84_011055 [Exophiala bonariae]